MVPNATHDEPHAADAPSCLWLERLQLTDFRNYGALRLDLDARPVVLTGPNGAGKTNLLEAVSLLAPGRGLRRAVFSAVLREGAADGWAISARLHTPGGPHDIGTGTTARGNGNEGGGRAVRIDGAPARGSGTLGDYVRLVWLTPAMDRLFSGPASDRRRFLDRLIQSLDPGYRASLNRYERAMRQRNRLLELNASRAAELDGFEEQMAESGVAIAAGRRDAVARLQASIAERRDAATQSAFPWATLALEGTLEEGLDAAPAVAVEDAFRANLAQARDRDAAAKRTLDGPHRSDLVIGHGPKGAPAHACSTGEQKALLIGLVLAHATLVKQRLDGTAPLLLLDEIAAHLDRSRRDALFDEIARLGAQTWMTGTDAEIFAPLGQSAQRFEVVNGGIEG